MHAPDRHELNAGWTLPGAYGVDRLVLLPKDPHMLFAYWEITPTLESSLRGQYADSWETGTLVLRIHDADSGGSRDLEIDGYADNWYFQVEHADRTYYVQMGRSLPDGRFVPILTSNTVRTPRDSISSVIDPRWKMFAFWQHRYDRSFRTIHGGDSSFAFQAGPSSYDIHTHEGPTGGEAQ